MYKIKCDCQKMSVLEFWILGKIHMAWLLTIWRTSATALNLSKIVESDIQEKRPFQQHCNADDSSSGSMSVEAVVAIVMCCLPYYPVTRCLLVCCFFCLVGVCCCWGFFVSSSPPPELAFVAPLHAFGNFYV